MYNGSSFKTLSLSEEDVRPRLKIIGSLCVLALFAVLVCFLYLTVRGGFYPAYPAAGFSNLSAPGGGSHADGDLLAQTDAGTLRGTYVDSAVAFMGITYARPPVGELRWEAPQPAMPWTGVRDANRPGPACTQVPAGLGVFLGPMAKPTVRVIQNYLCNPPRTACS